MDIREPATDADTGNGATAEAPTNAQIPVIDLCESARPSRGVRHPRRRRYNRVISDLPIVDFIDLTLPYVEIKQAYSQCPICYESSATREPTAGRCGHLFCKACILMSLRHNKHCPVCNRPMRPAQLLHIYL